MLLLLKCFWATLFLLLAKRGGVGEARSRDPPTSPFALTVSPWRCGPEGLGTGCVDRVVVAAPARAGENLYRIASSISGVAVREVVSTPVVEEFGSLDAGSFSILFQKSVALGDLTPSGLGGDCGPTMDNWGLTCCCSANAAIGCSASSDVGQSTTDILLLPCSATATKGWRASGEATLVTG